METCFAAAAALYGSVAVSDVRKLALLGLRPCCHLTAVQLEMALW